MKPLLLLLALSAVAGLTLAAEEASVTRVSQALGGAPWRIREKWDDLNGALLTKTRKVALEQAGFGEVIVVFAFRREDAPNVVAILKKYGEWIALARKNKVTSLKKEIGKVLDPYGTAEHPLFFVIESGGGLPVYKLTSSEFPKLSIDERDLPVVLGLIEQLPAMDKELDRPLKRGADSLFK